ncbi:hypothetical protein SAPIO_CDS6597 [Scedosporium apiospermum]|uniref:Transposase Tc1-like domain-containing protein n=1 Tax=Pseudallescheria apiosperma TaxID=563466 RepID=A0A084G3I9_PSEDA|nr:uncharacterized protein SAPIO_CDS6597 [Scedosporium apiospermum]KEZ41901.1 hypothetical protein SAPIO_CDS6597 [Scedosporium apiospermum]
MAPATGPGTGTRHLTDRERYRVRVLFFDGHKTRAEIASITGYTPRQITNAIRHETVAPRTGRPPSLTPAQQERLDSFVSESVENSRMTYQKISQTLFDGQVSESAIRNTLHRLGYRRNGAFNAGARLVRSHPRQTNASTPSGSGEIPPPTAPTDTNAVDEHWYSPFRHDDTYDRNRHRVDEHSGTPLYSPDKHRGI